MTDRAELAAPSLLTVRQYGSEVGDWQMVSAWWSAHTHERALAETILPPMGIIVERNGEPVGACWCHLSAGIGVAFLESPVTKPGLSLSESSEVMAVALDAIEGACRMNDYGVLFANTLPGIARYLERRHGFARAGDRVQMIKRID